ncbi:MAG: hypothetical protein FWC93_02270 [Defluviitaleaceae bacterium]|nr:hypothetical protein [Defluviitaleaceae bacterium]
MEIKGKPPFSAIVALVSLTVFVTGLILVFNSAGMAQTAGNNAVRANFGSMDTAQFLLIIENSARAYAVGGAVLALLGGLGLLVGAVMVFWDKR